MRAWCLFVTVSLAAAVSAVAGDAEWYRRGSVGLFEEVVFGGEEGPEEAVLFRVSWFDVDGVGNVFVADMTLHCVKKFAPTGELAASIGTEGAGPGDLRRPTAVAACENGDVIVYELGNRRVQRLTPGGEHVASELCYDYAQGLALGPAGEVYALLYVIPQGMSNESTCRVVRFSEAMDTTATLDEMTTVTMATVSRGDSYMMTSLPYPAGLEWALLPDGNVVTGHGDTNRLRILAPDGTVLRTMALEGERMWLGEEHKKKFWSRFMRDGRIEIDPDLEKAIEFPDRLPYFTGVYVDDAGHIIVRWGEPVDGRVTFVVLDGNGEFVSRVTTPELPHRLRFRGGTVYALHSDPAELPTVVRYRFE